MNVFNEPSRSQQPVFQFNSKPNPTQPNDRLKYKKNPQTHPAGYPKKTCQRSAPRAFVLCGAPRSYCVGGFGLSVEFTRRVIARRRDPEVVFFPHACPCRFGDSRPAGRLELAEVAAGAKNRNSPFQCVVIFATAELPEGTS